MRNLPTDQLEELKPFCSTLSIAEEGGLTYILLQQLKLCEGSTPDTVDALLCPEPRDGYLSRIFFSQKVRFPGLQNPNWNADGVRILEKNWHAISWKTRQENLRLAQILSDHLTPHS